MRAHIQRITLGAAAIAVVLVFGLTTAHAQNKCLAGKTKCVNKKMAGLLTCSEKCQQSPAKCGSVQTACEDKVIAKFDGGANGTQASCFEKLEARNDGPCVTFDDLADMEAKADALVANVVGTLEGSVPYSLCGNNVLEGAESCDGGDLGGASCASLGFLVGTLGCTAGCGYDVSACVPNPPITCGNGSIDGGEDCDLGNLNGKTCATQGFVAGALACGAGCVFDTSGCFAVRYADTGLGTIIDHLTGLEWEKKDGAGGGQNLSNPHDVDNRYTWDQFVTISGDGFLDRLNNCASPNGTTITGGFAGHCDWRLPSIVELQTILLAPNPCGTSPCIDAIFGPTVAGSCWSATTGATNPGYAWDVDFYSGGVFGYGYKFNFDGVRAVRSGS